MTMELITLRSSSNFPTNYYPTKDQHWEFRNIQTIVNITVVRIPTDFRLHSHCELFNSST